MNDICFVRIIFSLLVGDWARYPFKLRGRPLVTALSLSRTSRKQNRSQSARLRFSYAVPSCDCSLSLPKLNVYGKEQHPQGNQILSQKVCKNCLCKDIIFYWCPIKISKGIKVSLNRSIYAVDIFIFKFQAPLF